MYPPQPPAPPSPPDPTGPPDPSDPVVASITSLVQEGTLSPVQARRVYVVVHPATQSSRRLLSASRGYGSGWSLEQLSAGVAGLLGGGLVVAAALVANTLANRRGDFNWPAFVLELLAGLVIVATAYAAWKLLPRRDATAGVSTGVASWLAALGIVTLGLAVDTAMNEQSATPYFVGLVMLGLSAGAYFLLRGAVLTISALAGLAVFYGAAASDTVSPDSALGVALVVVLFGAVTIGAGWLLPSRHLTGMIGGIIALYGVLISFVAGALFRIGPALGGSALQSNDNAALMLVGLLVTAALFGLHLWSRYPGYAVLGVVGAALVPSVGLSAIHPENMLWWSAGIAVLGGVFVLGAIAYRVGGVRPLFEAARTVR